MLFDRQFSNHQIICKRTLSFVLDNNSQSTLNTAKLSQQIHLISHQSEKKQKNQGFSSVLNVKI